MHRILITGTRSGCGKTTVTCAILAALKARKLNLTACKCGPDFIDPMFHRKVGNISACNLDPFFCDPRRLQEQVTALPGELAVIEGVMGYYDGIGPKGLASTYHVAQTTKTPAVLIIDAKSMFASAGAVLKGFLEYKPDSGIQGVIFNRISPTLYRDFQQIAADVGVPALGYLPRELEVTIGSRHLGLITAAEINDLQNKLARLGQLAEEHILLDALLDLAKTAPRLQDTAVDSLQKAPAPTRDVSHTPPASVRIAVAHDLAFCFIYPENLAHLTACGAELVFFSPLEDRHLPENIQGLYLPGGYPELHLPKLSANRTLMSELRQAVDCGLPTIAEAGGFLLLHEAVDDYPMAGVLPARAFQTNKLQRFGYLTLVAQSNNLLCRKGDSIRAHEFHTYTNTATGSGFKAYPTRGRSPYTCIHTSQTLFAGFPHLYFPANPTLAENFLHGARRYT